MIVYISGPITGQDLKAARKRFRAWTTIIGLKGHTVVNPFDVAAYEEYKPWQRYMSECLEALLLCKCDCIFMLDGWKESRGARIELAVAKELGLMITYEESQL